MHRPSKEQGQGQGQENNDHVMPHLGGDGDEFQPGAEAEQRIRAALACQLACQHLNRHRIAAMWMDAGRVGVSEGVASWLLGG